MSRSQPVVMRRRIIALMIIMSILCSGVLIGRIFYLQVVTGDELQKRALDQQLYSTTLNAQRGNIYDRNGRVLAMSATVWTVFLSPADISDSEGGIIAEGLAEILEVDPQLIRDRLEKKESYYEVIKSKIEKDVADKVIEFINENDINGVHLEEDNKRYYPYGAFASTVLGFTNYDNQGAYGIESYYNSVLSGTPGVVVSAKNAKGTEMPFSYEQVYEAKDGSSLVLTLDEVIQHYVEKHLETAVKEHDVKARAVGIVMDPKTGEILAMATKGDFDPNDPYTITNKDDLAVLESLAPNSEEYAKAKETAWFNQWRNKAISDPYEPGSVFKIITASAAYETDTVSLYSHFYCPGYHIVANQRISCWKPGGHGDQTFAQAIYNSCNPAFMMIGEALGAENYYDYFENFGFTEITGIDLPGEAGNEGLYHTLASLTAHNPSVELASSSFGQTFKVTPSQLITAVSAAVNGGKLMKPYIVKKIIDSDGNVVETTEPEVKRQVVSEETSKTISLLLEGVVTEGSGRNARVPGYRIGGKTGTSEKIDKMNATGEDKNVLSFCGFAPVDDPQVVVLVLLDEPNLNGGYGSTIAAPVVGAIMSDILPYLGIEPSYTEEELAKKDITVPNVKGMGLLDAQSTITQKSLKYRIIGSGTTVLRQSPGGGEPIPKEGTVVLYTDTSQPSTVTVPDVVGLTNQQAIKMISNAGLNIRISGADAEDGPTLAARQTPSAGENAEIGSVVTVEFIYNELSG